MLYLLSYGTHIHGTERFPAWMVQSWVLEASPATPWTKNHPLAALSKFCVARITRPWTSQRSCRRASVGLSFCAFGWCCGRALGAATGRLVLAARRALGVGRSTRLAAASSRLVLAASPLWSAEAPDLLQHPAALSLLQDAFLASFEQVCSVLALLSAGASVDWADTVNAKKANAPRKSFFVRLLSFIRFAGLSPSCERQDTNSLNKSRG